MNLPEQLRIDKLECYFNWARNFPVSSVQFLVGCAVFATFYSRRSESTQIWILFASFSHVLVYSHHLLHIRFKIFARICIQIFDSMQKIYVAANILLILACQYSHTSEYSLCIASNTIYRKAFHKSYASITGSF